MKAATKSVIIQGIEINIPVGSMDKPSQQSEATMKQCQDKRGWKYPQHPFWTFNKSEAEDLAYCYNWYLGGYEMEEIVYDNGQYECTKYVVTSKGYYHYVGA